MSENADRVREIIDEIKELVEEAYRLCPTKFLKDRAKAYWRGSILMALDRDHEYVGSDGAVMSEIADALDEFNKPNLRTSEGETEDES